MSTSLAKTELRNFIRKKLNQISSAEKNSKGRALSKRLSDTLDSLNVTGHIGAFAPLDDEPRWDIALNKKQCQRLAFPKLINKQMVYMASNLEDLVPTHEFGTVIKTPSHDNAKRVLPELVLVPALAFTRDGNRLGRGKGFFDQYLKDFKGLKIGICFDEQIVEELPLEEHDQKVNWVVTDLEVIKAV